jgi:hypothetical protein
LKTAGADPKILAAVDSAKVVVDQAPETESGKALLQHIATAGSMIKDKRNDEAANELTAAVTASFLQEAPDFPEAHTKMTLAQLRPTLRGRPCSRGYYLTWPKLKRFAVDSA